MLSRVRSLGRALALISVPLLCGSGIEAATSIQGAPDLSVTVDPSGSYNIRLISPVWEFGGTVGHPLSNVAAGNGIDAVGPYSEVAFDFQAGAPRHAAIRAYWNRKAVLFQLTAPSGGPNTVTFPNFSETPALGLNHLAFSDDFGSPEFTSLPADSPWVFFDSAGHTFVFSAAAHFMVSASSSNASTGQIGSGISTQIATLPAGFSQQALLVLDNGVNSALESWGEVLTTLQGKVRRPNDGGPILNQLGYWTDNGASYYYATQSSLSYMDSLAAVKSGFDNLGIQLGYMQLDSWFYPKGPNADWTDSAGGIFQYEAAPALFGSNLASFAQRLGVPLVTHARWIDTSSPYRQQYAMSGNVSIDANYWMMLAGYLKASGVAMYEQDWLNAQAQTAFNLTDPDAFLDGMASSTTGQGIDVLYCMPTPRHYLQSSRYSNVTSIRVSDDGFGPSRWTNFLYGSRLASALGLWPFSDVLMSTATENLLLATLSAGPLGVGDRIGALSGLNLLRAVRPDGVIVKPDAPMVPTDGSFQNSAQAADAPMIAYSYTDFGKLKAWYIFSYPQGQNTSASFRLTDFGAEGAAYLYDYFAGAGTIVNAGDPVTIPIIGSSAYLIAAPVGRSGMAVVGDVGHFVTLGKKRISELTDAGAVKLEVAFTAAEMARTILIYSPAAPHVRALDGAVTATEYDINTGLFRVTLAPGSSGSARIEVFSNRGEAPLRHWRALVTTPTNPR